MIYNIYLNHRLLHRFHIRHTLVHSLNVQFSNLRKQLLGSNLCKHLSSGAKKSKVICIFVIRSLQKLPHLYAFRDIALPGLKNAF